MKHWIYKPSRFSGFDIYDENDGEPFKIGHFEREDHAKIVSASYDLLHALSELMDSIQQVTEGELIAWKDIVEAEEMSKHAITKALLGND